MRRSRRLGGLLAVSLLVAGSSLTGCSVARGFGVGNSTVPSDALCPGKPKAKHITVINWWQTSSVPAMLSSAKEFNCEHPEIAVNISIAPNAGDDSNGKLLAAVSAGKPPDLVLSWDDVLASWSQKGEIRPIDDLAGKYGIQRADFVPKAWDSAVWNGKLYGLPVDWDPDAMLWYNKKVFRQVGLDPEKPPTTWAELQKYASKIDKVKGGTIKRLGFVPWAGWGFNYIQMGHLFGAEFKVGDTPEIQIDSAGFRRSFSYIHAAATRYGGAAKVNSFTTVTGAQGAAADPLLSGRLGMELIGDWEIGQQANVGQKVFDDTLGVVQIPTPPGGTKYLSHSGWSFMVPEGAKHPDEAMQFATWMQEPKNFVKHIAPANGWLPARTETRSQSFYTESKAWQQVLAIEKEAGQDWWLPPSPILQQYYRILDETNASITALETTVDPGLRKAQTQGEAVLRNAIALGIYR